MTTSISKQKTYDTRQNIELCAVATTDETALSAIRSGADSVYLDAGIDNATAKVCGTTTERASVLCRYIRQEGRLWYLYLNKIFNERSLQDVFRLLEWAQLNGASGFLISDTGVLRIALRYFSQIPVHGGPLLNIHTADGVRQLAKMGVSRVILSEELNIEEITQIAKAADNIEYQVTIHGESCFSSPGLCQCSSYAGRKSAKFTSCDRLCRNRWSINGSKDFYLSRHDICAINCVDRLVDAGITSMSISGYSDMPNIVEKIALIYRTAIDATGTPVYRPIHKNMASRLKNSLSRVFDEEYYTAGNSLTAQTVKTACPGKYIGSVLRATQRKLEIELSDGNSIHKGDTLVIYDNTLEAYSDITVSDLRKDSDTCYTIILNRYFPPGSPVYLIRAASWDNSAIKNELAGIYKYYTVEDPHGKLTSERHLRRRQFVEDMRKEQIDATRKGDKPMVFARFENPQWSFLLNDNTVDYATFVMNTEYIGNIESIAEKWKKHRSKVVFELPPLIFDTDLPAYKKAVEYLLAQQYRSFAVNNIGQLPLFEGKNVTLMAGADITCLNRQSVLFLREQGISYATYCLEADYVNFQALASHQTSCALCLTVFFVPVIMRSRIDLSAHLQSGSVIEDTKGGQFIVIRENKSTILLPSAPVSITHLIAKFKTSDLAGIIIDLSYITPSTGEWERFFTAYDESEAISGATQFNFFSKLR